MKINTINNNFINFKENTLSREMNSQDAILMLRSKNASVKFQQNKEFAQNADSVNSNVFVSLGYKLYRTFNMIKENNSKDVQNEQKQFSALA